MVRGKLGHLSLGGDPVCIFASTWHSDPIWSTLPFGEKTNITGFLLELVRDWRRLGGDVLKLYLQPVKPTKLRQEQKSWKEKGGDIPSSSPASGSKLSIKKNISKSPMH